MLSAAIALLAEAKPHVPIIEPPRTEHTANQPPRYFWGKGIVIFHYDKPKEIGRVIQPPKLSDFKGILGVHRLKRSRFTSPQIRADFEPPFFFKIHPSATEIRKNFRGYECPHVVRRGVSGILYCNQQFGASSVTVFHSRDTNNGKIGPNLRLANSSGISGDVLSGSESEKQKASSGNGKGHHNPLGDGIFKSKEPSKPIPPLWHAFAMVGAIIAAAVGAGIAAGH